ncbi:transglutaminase family protein [Aurantimonas sp. Leaf443]|uniref:transglutaminase family protein n=1 Tax=Aurantimonas sp. Leaf443 TaxID=1736378 RepID=UPI0006F967EB|nr:transglutaminase family protein [Aurantimonas sp. Leaf443]KQT85183.1 hypothetical protein ASG48_07890 [Aurantimonas sp. Leaf443]
MIYDITLRLGYHYLSPVRDARHVLRVRPLADRFQTIESAGLEMQPQPDEAASETDFFGNRIDPIALHARHGALKVTMRSRVAVERPELDLSATPALSALVRSAAHSRDPSGTSPIHFLGASRMVQLDPGAGAYVAATLRGSPLAGEAMLSLAARIKTEFDYAPGTTTVRTTVAEAFAHRRGVCQDFSHVMIAGLRACGVPAAYVSGFIRTLPPPGQKRLEGADAMHAWVDVWLGPEIGWVGFDPTNGVATSSDHIVVARGRDYADVAPIDGVMMTAGPQSATHSVDVVPLEETLAAAGEAMAGAPTTPEATAAKA